MSDRFVKLFSRKTKYRKLRNDNERLFAENAQIKREIELLKKQIDQKFLFFTNTFYGLEDIKYNNPDLKVMQEVDLMLLRQFKELCAKNNIEYWLHAGTLLGAVRHGGFIPWDDDIDIAMTRDNFNRLESALVNDKDMVLNYHYIVNDCQKIGRVYFMDLYGKDDLVFIDIYIYDFLDISDKKEFQLSFNKAWNQLNSEVLDLRAREHLDMDEKTYMKLNPQQAKISNLERLISKFLSNFEIKHDGEYLKNLTHFPDRNAIVKTSTVLPLKTITFEGNEYTVPNNIDEYLRALYSNYMILRTDAGYSRHRSLISRYDKIQELRNFKNEHSKHN